MPRFPFFDPQFADDEGIVGIGGNLSPPVLLEAYRRGIFPYFDETSPILWWSPDPRGIFELNGFHVSRRLARTIRSKKFQLTINTAFPDVMAGCADREEGTWITPDMVAAYTRLHEMGHAHSVEVWHEGKLAGGTYGVTVGGLFAGESMFTRVRDASKVALAFLINRLGEQGFMLFDIQFVTDHTASLGAVAIPRDAYLARLRRALRSSVQFA